MKTVTPWHNQFLINKPISHPLVRWFLLAIAPFVQILKIDRGSEVIDFPLADTRLLAGDRLIVYGKIDALTQMIMQQ